MCCRGEPHWIGQSKFSANYNTSQKLWNLIIRRRSFTFLHLIDFKILVPLHFCMLISINMIPASFSENLLVRFGTQILPHPFNSWVMAFEPFPKSAGKGRLDAKWMDGWMELRRPKHTALACQMDGVLKERRTKKRSLQGLQLKVGARRASRLLVFIYSKGRRLAIKLSAYRWLKVIQMCQSEGTAPLQIFFIQYRVDKFEQ